VDGRELVQLDFGRAELSDSYHLSQLFITDKSLIDFEDGLLENEINWVFEDFFGVRFDHVLPDLFVEGELHPLP
jgi:hypothetical protein